MNHLQVLWLSVTLVTMISTHGNGFSYQTLKQNAKKMPVEENVISREVVRPYVSTLNTKSFKKDWVSVKILETGPKVVRAGERVEFDCQVNGSPTPNLYWIRGAKTDREINEILKNGIADASWEGISRVDGKLVIECVTPEDEGLIYCAGVSGSKIQLARTLLLIDENRKGTCDVLVKPTITLHVSMMFSNLDSTVVIPCRASGNPQPEIYWLDNLERRIDIDNSRYSILENGDLLIENITWDDMGRFLCVAQSGDSEVSAETFLYPLKPTNDKRR